MTRRRMLLLGSVAVVAALAVQWWAIQPALSAINAVNAAKVEKGMTLAEVEAILGGPARDELTGPVVFDRLLSIADCDSPQSWLSDEVVVRVCFDERGHA